MTGYINQCLVAMVIKIRQIHACECTTILYNKLNYMTLLKWWLWLVGKQPTQQIPKDGGRNLAENVLAGKLFIRKILG